MFDRPMYNEGEPGREPPPDLANMEVIDQILFSGTPTQRRTLQDFHELTDEQMDRLVYYTHLRHEAHDQSDQDAAQRIQDHPEASQEELDLGTYIENLEPHVRQAVLTFRKKGYPTYESGFYAASETQTIGLSEPLLDGFTLPEELVEDDRILKWDITPDHITFQPRTGLTMVELKNIWNAIADALPDLGTPASPSTLPFAEGFRDRQRARKEDAP